MRFKPYPSYKPSGVEWLGEVPDYWDVSRFKWYIERNDGGVWGGEPDGENDTIVLRSTEQTVSGKWDIKDPASRKLSQQEKEMSLLLEGDLLVTKSSGSSLHIGKTTLVTSDIAATSCCYSNFMQRIRTSHRFSPKFAWYVMNNDLARLQFDYLSNSTTGLANLNGTMIGEMTLAAPSEHEQSAIAFFLDRETAKIDTLIAKQEKLIELLKEKRQAIISHAVTKGLNPNVKMKDSGIEWLGVVPKHWDVSPLKRFADVIDCKHHTVEFLDQGLPIVSIRELRDDKIDLTSAKLTSKEQWDFLREGRAPQKGDMIFCRNASVGAIVYVYSEEPFCMGQDVCLIRTKIGSRFMYFQLTAQLIRKQIDALLVGATIRRANVEEIRGLIVVYPPETEQVAIVEFLDRETTKIDALIAKSEQAITLQKEHRAALISAAVTGKIDVRGSQTAVETE